MLVTVFLWFVHCQYCFYMFLSVTYFKSSFMLMMKMLFVHWSVTTILTKRYCKPKGALPFNFPTCKKLLYVEQFRTTYFVLYIFDYIHFNKNSYKEYNLFVLIHSTEDIWKLLYFSTGLCWKCEVINEISNIVFKYIQVCHMVFFEIKTRFL